MRKQMISLAAIFCLIVALVFGGIYVTRNLGKSEKVVTQEEATTKLAKMVKKIDPKEGSPVKSAVEYTEADTSADELPDIDTCDVPVNAATSLYAEIFSSPEKAGSGSDGWLTEMAEAFNKEKYEMDGQRISVQIRSVSSGQAMDYITTGKAVPDGYTPSASLWISMLNAKGIKTETIMDSMVSNTAGIVISNSRYKELVDQYGSLDLKTIVDAVETGELQMGYTNPFSSTAGLNFLICTLQRYDKNPLSQDAIDGFSRFQKNVPFVALTTVQMRNAASSGSLDGFILEYQLYQNDPSLSGNYTFIPYGYEHDNPLVTISSTSKEKKEILKKFAEYCETEQAKKLAKKDGFYGMEDYKCEYQEVSGETLLAAQKLYKKNKDGEKPVIGIFVADVSGSMGGEPLAALKDSLVNSMKYINSENYIGLVSYSDDVTIELPIAKFDLNQQSLFKGTVEKLEEGGGTATYDGICVALDMIQKQLEITPDAKTMIFVLSDGETNRGHSFNDIKDTVSGLKVPVYTIGYNADLDALQKISEINEAASINANTDDVIYQIKMLFNSSL